MAEYVAEMAVRVVTPQGQVTQPFRKFVSQVLTSTRLPSTTILLGMNYLAKRINVDTAASGGAPQAHAEGQVWRLLTVALLLASKFLDDNTFQNRSWAEVSGIPAVELNSLEQEWLKRMDWCLFVNLDLSRDYTAWLANWAEWLESKKRERAQAQRERQAALSPLNTDVGRPRHAAPHGWPQKPQVIEYDSFAAIKRPDVVQQPALPRPGEMAWQQQHRYQSWAAPLTPPDSGYGTPDSRYTDWFNMQMAQPGYGRSYRQGSGPTPFPPNGNAAYPSYYPRYGPTPWEPVAAECSCVNCASPTHTHNKPPYFVASGYQPVMG